MWIKSLKQLCFVLAGWLKLGGTVFRAPKGCWFDPLYMVDIIQCLFPNVETELYKQMHVAEITQLIFVREKFDI